MNGLISFIYFISTGWNKKKNHVPTDASSGCVRSDRKQDH